MYCINYMIKGGDTLFSISRHFNVLLEEIIIANPFVDVYNLPVGEVICIPVSVPQNTYTNFTTYLVEDGDTLGSVLRDTGANLADLMQLNDMNSIYLEPGSTLQVPIFDEGEDEVTL